MAYYSQVAGVKRWFFYSAMICCMWCSPTLFAHAETRDNYIFASHAAHKRFDILIHQFRCLVCQNQSLADSDAELAKDLRQQIYTMVSDNKSDQAIVDFMVGRYGNFVLYEPPLRFDTSLLWFGPFILLVLGFTLLAMLIKRRHQAVIPIKNFDELLKNNQSL